MGEMSEHIYKQEKIISELNTFFHKTLSQVFNKIVKHKEPTLEQVFFKTGQQMNQINQNDPFQLYTAYTAMYRPL